MSHESLCDYVILVPFIGAWLAGQAGSVCGSLSKGYWHLKCRPGAVCLSVGSYVENLWQKAEGSYILYHVPAIKPWPHTTVCVLTTYTRTHNIWRPMSSSGVADAWYNGTAGSAYQGGWGLMQHAWSAVAARRRTGSGMNELNGNWF